jgi:hypothetical protein
LFSKITFPPGLYSRAREAIRTTLRSSRARRFAEVKMKPIPTGALITEGKRADVALDFEGLVQESGPGGVLDMGSIARRSSDEWQVTVTARSGHSSGIFSPAAGAGAIYELARIIEAFRRELPQDKLTFNVGLIGGGTSAELTGGKIRVAATGKGNVIAGQAIARGDLRAISREQIARTQEKMRAIVARPLDGAKSEILFEPDGYPPMAPSDANRALLARLNAINGDMGLAEMGELDPVKRGAADISFVRRTSTASPASARPAAATMRPARRSISPRSSARRNARRSSCRGSPGNAADLGLRK